MRRNSIDFAPAVGQNPVRVRRNWSAKLAKPTFSVIGGCDASWCTRSIFEFWTPCTSQGNIALAVRKIVRRMRTGSAVHKIARRWPRANNVSPRRTTDAFYGFYLVIKERFVRGRRPAHNLQFAAASDVSRSGGRFQQLFLASPQFEGIEQEETEGTERRIFGTLIFANLQ